MVFFSHTTINTIVFHHVDTFDARVQKFHSNFSKMIDVNSSSSCTNCVHLLVAKPPKLKKYSSKIKISNVPSTACYQQIIGFCKHWMMPRKSLHAHEDAEKLLCSTSLNFKVIIIVILMLFQSNKWKLWSLCVLSRLQTLKSELEYQVFY